MIKNFINRVVQGENLAAAEMTAAMNLILDGLAKPSQIAAFLVALRLKGETVEEIAAAAETVRQYDPRINISDEVVVLDRDEINLDEETVFKACGLAGGATRTFNISTATALTAAGGGLKIAKFGSRAESSFCGSANVVAALGINLDLTLTEVERSIEQVGLGFLYANLFHTPLALPTQVRQEIGVRTIFNLIGPLSNPAGGKYQVLGVYLPERTRLMAQVLTRLGCERAMVVHGQDALDELTITGPTQISRVEHGWVEDFEFWPRDAGLPLAQASDITGGGAEENAAIIRRILDGEPGPRRNVVLLNAAAAFFVAGRVPDLSTGVEMAAEAIDSGRARNKLDELIDFTSKCGVYQHKDVS
ncbi:MAG: anthranilate phosphoribosyltransferase [Pseudomonadota bacterium]